MSKKTAAKAEEFTVEQKMALAIAKAKEARRLAKDEARLALLENGEYVNYLADIEDELDQVTKLTAIMEQLNKIKPIVTNDDNKYGVNIFPIAEYIFGPVMSRVLGIVNGSSAMFTDERQEEFRVITGLSHLSATKARDAIGSPAYYSKGNLTNSIPANGESLNTAMTAVCESLGIDIKYADKVNESTLERWFNAALAKAEKQYGEFKKVEIVDAENNFVLEEA
jgi:hypothetical protein